MRIWEQNKSGDKMSSVLFMMIMIIKDIFEMIALKRGDLEKTPIRLMLIVISGLLLHLIFYGVLETWPTFIQIFFIFSLICDIIVICSKKIVRKLGGNQE